MPYVPIPFRLPRMSEAERVAASRQFLKVMQARRSVRAFSPDPVPEELIDNAIRAAASAPSGANQQPWTFVVVTDPELRRRIRAAAEAEERESYEHRMSDEWLDALQPLGTDWRKPHITDAACVIVVFEQVYGLVEEAGGSVTKVKHYYTRESVGIAVGLLLASLTHAGLATLTHTPSPMGFLRRILERPPNERPYVLIPVGYPAADATVPDIRRKSLDEVCIRR
jgi:iodotyrosine deiodinase